MTVTLRYADAPAAITAHVIHRYRAGEIPSMDMSNSGGPKPYMRNLIFTAFSQIPGTLAVWYVMAHMTPFLLWELEDGRRIDAAGREVVIE